MISRRSTCSPGDGVAALVREALGEDPFSGTIFIFRSKRADRLKIVAWDGSGLVLLWKRLEHGAFVVRGDRGAQRFAAPCAGLGELIDRGIGRLAPAQGLAPVPVLPARLLAGPFPQTADANRLLQAVACCHCSGQAGVPVRRSAPAARSGLAARCSVPAVPQ
jgi:hypothetical protein